MTREEIINRVLDDPRMLERVQALVHKGRMRGVDRVLEQHPWSSLIELGVVLVTDETVDQWANAKHYKIIKPTPLASEILDLRAIEKALKGSSSSVEDDLVTLLDGRNRR